MSSSQELYNHLNEKLRELVHVKKPETDDELNLDHCRHDAKSIIKYESYCELSAEGNQSGVKSYSDPTLVDESACKGLNDLQEDFGTCVGRLVRGRGRYHFGRSDGIWRSLANLSSFLAAWLSSHSTGVDHCGRKRLGESRPVAGHVGEGAKNLEEICEAGDVFLQMPASEAVIGPNYA